MKYKVLAFDIDGTLVNTKKEILPSTKKAIEAAAQAGCIIAIASGRPTPGVRRYEKELNLPKLGGYLLCFNGGGIIRCEDQKILDYVCLEQSDYREICALAKSYGVNILTYEGDTCITDNAKNKYVEIEYTINTMPYKQVDDVASYVTWPVPKFILCGEGDYLAKIEPEIYEKLHDRFDVYRSEPFFLEILPKNVNKGTSLEKFLRIVGCTRDELMCFGDGFNDISMLKYAGLGVAMGNARDEVKAYADYIAKSNDDDAIAEVINKFVLD